MGEYQTVDDIREDCNPVVTNTDLFGENLPMAADGVTPLVGDAPANPCGLIAKSLFNDEYFLYKPGGEEIKIDADDIAWDSDMDAKYKNCKPCYNENGR